MTRAEAEAAQIDVGLRQHMLQVYNYMASGVALTGIVAYAASHTPALMQAIFGTPLQWVVMLAPLAFVMVLSFGINRLSLFTSQLLFWLFAGVMGLSLSSIFLIYTGESIARVFFITAASFSALSLYGYTTKRDLGPMRSFLVMGLIGIIIASVVNMFMQSSAMQFVISVVGVLVFAGLTAYDTQRIKLMYMESDSHETTGKKAIMGALTL
ncbi:MAG: Bax inhibitor-1/YccA family protein, partial [Rhodospirillales bacterium]|nr:Bax inhibitor-1/YccA family protein [Rhodospirillales bacterium]